MIDRHSDNILVKTDGTLFNIDFAYILGERIAGLDASKIAIPKKFEYLLGKKFKKFVDIVCDAFLELRRNYVQLMDYARIVFAFMNKMEDNEKYFRQAFMLHKSEEEAVQHVRMRFEKASSNVKTKLKNVLHSVAVRRTSNRMN